jgi:hypothetical protein
MKFKGVFVNILLKQLETTCPTLPLQTDGNATHILMLHACMSADRAVSGRQHWAVKKVVQVSFLSPGGFA